MLGLLLLGALVSLVGVAGALPDTEIRLLESLLEEGAAARAQEQAAQRGVSKRDLEFNQYVPAYRLRGEPSCEELRAMWRLSKREARRATSTNNLPRSRPYSYSRLIAFAPSPHQRQFIYGEPRNFAPNPKGHSSFKGSFNTLRSMLGVGAGRPGSFQRMRGVVASQRKPGETSKGKFNELRGMVLGDAKSSPEENAGVSPNLQSSQVYQPVRRTPSERYRPQQSGAEDSKEGFVGTLLPGLGASMSLSPSAAASEWRLRPWNPQQANCYDIGGMDCQTHPDCACAGQYRCSKGRCKVIPVHPGIEDSLGKWFTGVLPRKELGSWSNADRWSG